MQGLLTQASEPSYNLGLDYSRNETNSGVDIDSRGLETVLEQWQNQSVDPTVTEQNSRGRKAGNPGHPYWCTICGFDHPQSYANSNSWKKHEKEHEGIYHCFYNETIETLKEGDVCRLCGLLRPDNVHMRKHNVEACLNAQQDQPKFKRRYRLISHLKDQHACIGSEKLAEKWWRPHIKQAWSCGFCVALFPSITERLQHIKLQHFDLGQTLHEWNPNNIIKGLLQQPMIKEAWLTRIDDKDEYTRQTLTWPLSDIPDLQRKLEMRVRTFQEAQILALAVWDHVKIDIVSFSTANSEAYNHTASNTPAPPSISNRTRPLQRRRNFVSPSELSLDLPREGLPRTRSATGSPHPNSHPYTMQEQWSGDFYGNSGGLATPLSDVSFNPHLHRPQSSTDEAAEVAPGENLFDDFIGN